MLVFGLWRWCLFLVLILRTDESVWTFSWLLIINVIKDITYWHGTSRISYCLKRLLHEVFGFAPAIILTIFLCKVKSSHCWKSYPKKNYSIFYNINILCIVNWCECVNVTVVRLKRCAQTRNKLFKTSLSLPKYDRKICMHKSGIYILEQTEWQEKSFDC
jgi:hypothetical protein